MMENPGKSQAQLAHLLFGAQQQETSTIQPEGEVPDKLWPTDHEIRAVVRSLCQGTPDEQRRTLETYFTKDASFIHPFCIVPSFKERQIPLLGCVSSRDLLKSIFQWYRMLSPTIKIDIDSVLHDTVRDKLYLDMRQTFSIWFVPFYSAPVRLVTVLDLATDDDHTISRSLDSLTSSSDGNKDHQDVKEEKQALLHQTHQHHTSGRSWKISKQEDLYQVNEFLRFTGFGLLTAFWYLFQLGATSVCVFMSLFVRLSPWQLQKEPARGGVEAEIRMVEEKRKARGKEVAHYEDSPQSDLDTGNRSSDKAQRGSANSKASSRAAPVKSWKK